MNNKDTKEKHRGLSIAAIILGILAFVFAIIIFTTIVPIFGSYLYNFIPENFIIIFFASCVTVCFAIPAIICGSIDLKRAKRGQYSKKGKGLDIAGIVLGSVFILTRLPFLPGIFNSL